MTRMSAGSQRRRNLKGEGYIHESSHLLLETDDYFYNAKSNTFLSSLLSNNGAMSLGSASLTGRGG